MKLRSKLLLALTVLITLTACGNNADNKEEEKSEAKIENTGDSQVATSDDPINIKIGVVGEYNEVPEEVIKRYEQGTGNTAELVKFSDYSQPNEALLSGDIDINFFQHKKFLEDFNKSAGSDIVSIGDTVIAPLGIYSSKIESLDDLKDNAKVTIPDDASNGARALFLLQSAGFIKVEGKEGDLITIDNVVEILRI